MTMELRPASAPRSFDIFVDGEKAGEIRYVGPPGSIGLDGWEIEEEAWEVHLWSQSGSGKTWGESEDTLEEATETARAFCAEFVAERRELNRPVPGLRVIPVPMGGQPRRW